MTTLSRLDPRRAVMRMVVSASCGVGTYVLSALWLSRTVASMVAWDVAGLVLLSLSWATIMKSDASLTRTRAGAEDPGRTMVYVLVVLTSAASLLAATVLVRNARHVPGTSSYMLAALCFIAVSVAWVMTHTAFTFRYAHLYYREDAEGIGGVTFPGEELPAYFDFAYFAFTVGMCFQVSDVCVTSHQIRRAVLLHSVISFGYNSAILAFVLNLVFGLAT